jgi:Cu/Ag efflux protein CusF
MNALNKIIRLTVTTGIALAFACITLTALTSKTSAQTNGNATNHQVLVSETHHLKATVQKIDYDKREITLKGPRGNSVEFAVSDAVEKFPQIKKGDDVYITYYDSVALALAKPGDPAPTGRGETVIKGSPGEKPSGQAVTVSDLTATVQNIDRDTREVTLKKPDGDLVIVKVDPDVGDLKRIKEGDQITARRTKALAISVEKPE